MKLRVARHTADLARATNFYTEIIGLQVLGSFQNHQGYDGVFLGKPDMKWHLEFTTSSDPPRHQFDEDDILVFYPSSDEFQVIKDRIRNSGLELIQPKNPYWTDHGFLVLDPDGFRIMVSSQGFD